MFDFSGKRALITGASGGIGSEIAESLHLKGATVTLSGTRERALDALASKLGERVHVVVGDLSSVKDSQYLLDATNNSMGEINILVNNAGITKDKLAMRMTDEDWQLVLEVNLGAVFRLSRGCLRSMIKRRWGRIVNITSVVGASGNSGQANYAAAKAGTTGMTKAIAAEVASRGITVNCVAPGYIVTPMTDSLDNSQKESLLTMIPIGRLGKPKDVAACVSFLASDEAAYVTGQTLHVNGGMLMI
ncbi:MAG TPA: 3-oxoacyl-[acyl-carrier-protein] reductase [Rhodospirillales bacterium]|jgi:3-oxoacyl-[acyl-carrier protein] reductase|nr:3-oxoacyl-[acyl-carrier-protein] reductase [Rhodospirillales bacterium]HIA80692.1 3-oxoacyl-[acyl-carrier-protein] reductase [Rhodospirillales bacterium]HIN74937.1 3-oxoacyl-[acyl-carrier-protein] reductase [Rhodospirillales bacterium]HIP10253.1 3-oxoacyl-[acyl-carrier-protein] reductase [Rhodospirillales bacterium]|tara:strand:- start:204 stop:941 length:738 start_codon:yes stop_codon:yes gene_type:complete